MSRRRIVILILIVILIVISTVQFLLLAFKPFTSDSFISIIAPAIATVGGVIGALYPFSSVYFEKKSQTKSKDLTLRFSLAENTTEQLNELNKEQKEKQGELFDVAKQQLDLDKERFELEQKRQAIVWQKEALALIDVSPRSAIIIAWLGIEQELQRTAKLLHLFDEKQRSVSSGEVLASLKGSENIDNNTFLILKDMQHMRNRVAHANLSEGELDSKKAFDYVQNSTYVLEKLSALTSKVEHT